MQLIEIAVTGHWLRSPSLPGLLRPARDALPTHNLKPPIRLMVWAVKHEYGLMLHRPHGGLVSTLVHVLASTMAG